MHLKIPSNKKSFSVSFGVYSMRPQQVRIVAFDAQRPRTRYTDRIVKIAGARNFQLKFPQSPQSMVVNVSPVQPTGYTGLSSLKGFNVVYGGAGACDIWTDMETRRFIKFAQEFSEKASYLSPGVYKSNENEYLIKYNHTIREMPNGGKPLSTPARIGNTTGNIEVSREKFLTYTVPARMVILLHEFSHKFMNHKIGRPINDELAADINALYIYLGLGYPHIDARTVFGTVFYGSKSELNIKRMNMIEDYITRFEKGEVVKGCR